MDTAECDATTCKFVAGVTNEDGKPVSQSTLTFHITHDANADVVSCSAPVPSLPHAGSADVSCSVGGPDWTAFYDSGRGGFRYQATVHDPLWDD